MNTAKQWKITEITFVDEDITKPDTYAFMVTIGEQKKSWMFQSLKKATDFINMVK